MTATPPPKHPAGAVQAPVSGTGTKPTRVDRVSTGGALDKEHLLLRSPSKLVQRVPFSVASIIHGCIPHVSDLRLECAQTPRKYPGPNQLRAPLKIREKTTALIPREAKRLQPSEQLPLPPA